MRYLSNMFVNIFTLLACVQSVDNSFQSSMSSGRKNTLLYPIYPALSYIQSTLLFLISNLPCSFLYPIYPALSYIQSTLLFLKSNLPCSFLYPIYPALSFIQSTLLFLISNLPCSFLYPIYPALSYIQSTLLFLISNLPCSFLYPIYPALSYIQSTLIFIISNLPCSFLYPIYPALSYIQSTLLFLIFYLPWSFTRVKSCPLVLLLGASEVFFYQYLHVVTWQRWYVEMKRCVFSVNFLFGLYILISWTLNVERGSSVGRLPDSQSREPGFESRCYRFEVWAFSFTSRRLSRLSCINEYLAIDSGGNVSELVVAQLLHG